MPDIRPKIIWGLRLFFLCLGLAMGTWGAHVPSAKLLYAIDEGTLASALITAGLAGIIGLSQAGRMVNQWGPPRAALITGGLLALCLVIVLLTSWLPLLFLTLAVFGFMACCFDIAINTMASELEHQSGRPLMSGFHGLFSLGGMCGAGLVAGLFWLEVPPLAQMALAAVWIALACGMAYGWTRVWASALHPEASERPRLVDHWRPLAAVGLLIGMGLLTEGAAYDWSVLFVRESLGASESLSVMAFAAFSGAMALGRFSGDWLRARLSSLILIRVSAATTLFGLGAVVLTTSPVVGIVGYGIAGLGLANVVPILFAAAGRAKGPSPAHNIAVVSALGTAGFMLGPPLVGFMAEVSSLRLGIASTLLGAALLLVLARRGLGELARERLGGSQ
jgi:predicted MFS family arabinose efflux permease